MVAVAAAAAAAAWQKEADEEKKAKCIGDNRGGGQGEVGARRKGRNIRVMEAKVYSISLP